MQVAEDSVGSRLASVNPATLGWRLRPTNAFQTLGTRLANDLRVRRAARRQTCGTHAASAEDQV